MVDQGSVVDWSMMDWSVVDRVVYWSMVHRVVDRFMVVDRFVVDGSMAKPQVSLLSVRLLVFLLVVRERFLDHLHLLLQVLSQDQEEGGEGEDEGGEELQEYN